MTRSHRREGGRQAPRTGLLALSLAILLLAPTIPALAQGPTRLPGLTGGELTDATLSQGAVIVVVWASWSPHCRNIGARVNAIGRRFGSQARVVTVDFQEDRGTVEGFLASQRFEVPVYLDADGAFSKKHAVTTLPSLLIFRDGRNSYRGKLPDDAETFIAQALQ